MPVYNLARYEQKTHGIYHRTDRDQQTALGCAPHLHRELELVYYLGGKTEAYADTVRCELQPGDVFLSFPDQIHGFDTHAPEKYFLFDIKPDLMPEFMGVFTQGIPLSPVIRGADKLPRVDTLLRMLADCCQSLDLEKSDKPLLRGILLALFSDLLDNMSISHVSAGESGALRAIVSYCTRNFNEDLSLSVLEEKLHLNKYYISHLFSGRLGLRFNDYINSLRVSEACKYLHNSTYSITEISELVGFNTLRTFNRAFVKQVGVSPTEYRKQDTVSV